MGNCVSQRSQILTEINNPDHSTTRPDSNTDSTQPQTMTGGPAGETMTRPLFRRRIRGTHNSALPSAPSSDREMHQSPQLEGKLKYGLNCNPGNKDNSTEEDGQTKVM
ncbi:MAG: hypothetical protein MHMPM18_001830 [Marteilia pararefringens]